MSTSGYSLNLNVGLWYMTETGKIYSDYGGDRLYLRPVINLKSDVKVSGTGTNSDPICG